jgi:hypothetical protein
LRALPNRIPFWPGIGDYAQWNGVYRRLLKMALEELQWIDTHIEQLEREALGLLQEHQDVVRRVAEVPGFGVDSALQMIAEVGPQAASDPLRAAHQS